MAETPPTYDGQPVRPIREDDDQRVLWLAVRRGLILIIRAIETRYDVSSDDRRKNAA